jgi:hypothetical protein
MSAEDHLGPQFIYHLASSSKRQQIQKTGLKKGPAVTGSAVWGWTKDPSSFIHEQTGIGMEDRDQDVWKADVRGLGAVHGSHPSVNVLQEWNHDAPVLAVRKRIPPTRLTLHRGSDYGPK